VKLSNLFKSFFESEKASGIVLIACTLISITLANSYLKYYYIGFINEPIGSHTLSHWINEGLMAFFFLLIGLELEREIYKGELSNLKNALLPFAGAIGGMLVPAGIFLFFTYGTEFTKGAGIPMATDIAFAIGALALLGNKVPPALKIFIAALAVIDDLGAVLIISFFYSSNISWMYLGFVALIWVLLFILNRFKINTAIFYVVGGIAMWYCMLHSGIHASITGIIMAFVIPFGDGNENSISYKLESLLQKPVAFFIVPLFVLVNTAIPIEASSFKSLSSPYGLGVIAGLFIGKPLGILSFCYVAVKLRICRLPAKLNFKHILSVACLGGIGFTMSIFITLLAYSNETVINNSKLAIIIGSLCAVIVGLLLLNITLVKQKQTA
jgi:Na+:H+ antiporter, NhaA family